MPKKILLIDPPFQKFMNYSKNGIPLGLLSIAGSLKDKGHEVKVFDADYNPHGINYPFIGKIEHYQQYLNGLHDNNHPIWQNISNIIESFSPDLVGITMQSTKVKSGLRVAEISKKKGVERVVVGGPHITLSTKDTISKDILSSGYVDGFGKGEAELNFEELFTKPEISSEYIQDLDSLPLPARDCLIGLNEYNPKDLGFLMAARGCPFNCSFCSSNALWGRGVRERSLENVFKEIEEINSKYKTQEFYIVDDTFTFRKKRVVDFGNWMKNRGFYWSCLTRADRVDEKLVQHMINSNCKVVKIGVESGNERVLKTMNKRTNLKVMEKAADVFNREGLPWVAYFIIGSPDETTEEMYDTMKFIQKIKPTFISPNIYTHSPGTEFVKKYGNLYEKSEDFGLEEANYHSLQITAGKIPKEELIKFMQFSDDYNKHSAEARKLFSLNKKKT